jgi:hypothetical protein
MRKRLPLEKAWKVASLKASGIKNGSCWKVLGCHHVRSSIAKSSVLWPIGPVAGGTMCEAEQ